jgi:hypothetical protein
MLTDDELMAVYRQATEEVMRRYHAGDITGAQRIINGKACPEQGEGAVGARERQETRAESNPPIPAPSTRSGRPPPGNGFGHRYTPWGDRCARRSESLPGHDRRSSLHPGAGLA